ncbi:hypothetical protein CROQUDRAFT_279631 [Cronartium quercuum f. sp. fusiforme G11]|uniref:Uncharacterized protein n=1 Tax=Cronartium quercuum f. sp. fusiforme G11 TaxID=708437 RepID=A0A9P6NDB1_9BASI|nr:hypothetical protein CROQUDRAFT_279631 [Cronartium quercuum f. sp. fusiforme G11]
MDSSRPILFFGHLTFTSLHRTSPACHPTAMQAPQNPEPSQKSYSPLPSSLRSTCYTKPICTYLSPWRSISVNQFFSTNSRLDISHKPNQSNQK